MRDAAAGGDVRAHGPPNLRRNRRVKARNLPHQVGDANRVNGNRRPTEACVVSRRHAMRCRRKFLRNTIATPEDSCGECLPHYSGRFAERRRKVTSRTKTPRRPLPPKFYARDTVRVARDLLGCVLQTRIRGRTTAGKIVEVEAYVGPNDPAAHGFGNRRTKRNDALFGPPGNSYVYFIYGMHWCFNAVTERDGYPGAVLIRALEPLVGIETMRRRRGTGKLGLLCSGPARLCQSLGITGRLNGMPLVGDPVFIARPNGRAPRTKIEVSGRIGVSKAADWPLRFVVAGSEWLSRKT